MSDLPNPAPDSPRMNGCPKCGKTAARIVPADRARISTLGEVLECLGCGEQYELRLAMLSVSASIAGTPEQTDAPREGPRCQKWLDGACFASGCPRNTGDGSECPRSASSEAPRIGYTPANAEQASRLIDLIDELAARVRDGRSMGLGDASIANSIRAQFLNALMAEWSDAVEPSPISEGLSARLEGARGTLNVLAKLIRPDNGRCNQCGGEWKYRLNGSWNYADGEHRPDCIGRQAFAGSATPASSDVLTEQADGMVRRLEGALRELEQLVKRDAKSDAQQVMDHTITSFVELRDHLRAPVPPSSSIAASETATTARPCTCHPADNPPRPCAEKYALSDCRPSADPSVTTDAETVNLPGWCLYCGGTYRTFAPGLAGCDNRECVRHPYINEANAAKKAAAWRGTPESSPAVPLCSQCGKHDARFACTDFLGAPAVDAGTTDVLMAKAMDSIRSLGDAVHVMRDLAITLHATRAALDAVEDRAETAEAELAATRSPAVDDETVKRDAADARRWRWFRQFLSVEDDSGEGGQYLFWHDDHIAEPTFREGFENTIESLVDAAISERPVTTPPASETRPEDRRDA